MCKCMFMYPAIELWQACCFPCKCASIEIMPMQSLYLPLVVVASVRDHTSSGRAACRILDVQQTSPLSETVELYLQVERKAKGHFVHSTYSGCFMSLRGKSWPCYVTIATLL